MRLIESFFSVFKFSSFFNKTYLKLSFTLRNILYKLKGGEILIKKFILPNIPKCVQYNFAVYRVKFVTVSNENIAYNCFFLFGRYRDQSLMLTFQTDVFQLQRGIFENGIVCVSPNRHAFPLLEEPYL